MPDPLTLNEFIAALVTVFGGREGLKFAVDKYKTKKNGGGASLRGVCSEHYKTLEKLVTKEVYLERHQALKDQIGELKTGQLGVADDVKEILKKLQF